MARTGPKLDPSLAFRHAVRRALRLLPPDRRAAAAMIAHGTGYFLRGQVPPPWATRPGEPPLDPRRESSARDALAAGLVREALDAADAILASHPRHAGALEVRAVALAAIGEVSEAHRTVRRLRAVADGPRPEALERRVTGQLRVAQPRWVPRLPGGPRPYGVPVDRRVLLLVADLASGEAAASLSRTAGYEPVLLMAPLPDPFGATAASATEIVHETVTPLMRVDLGPAYPPTAPLDRRIEDLAWLSTRIVEDLRPSLLHVTAGHALLERAALGDSLRSRYAVPLVIEADAASGPHEAAGSELARLRQIALGERLADADAAVTRVPAGSAAPAGAADRLRDAYAMALALRAQAW